MTVPSFIAGSSVVAYGTSATIAPPVGIQAGDLLVLFVDGGGPLTDANTPAGWTKQGVALREAANPRPVFMAVFTKTASASESNLTVTYAGSGGSGDISIHMAAYRGAAGVDVYGSQASSTVTTIPAPSVTTTGADALVARHWTQMQEALGVTLAAPNGTTSRINTSGHNGVRIQSLTADAAQVTPGATGAASATVSGLANNAVGWTVALSAAVSDTVVAGEAFATTVTALDGGIAFVAGEAFATTATMLDGTVAPQAVLVNGQAFAISQTALTGSVIGAEVRVAGEAFAISGVALSGTATLGAPATAPVTTSSTFANDGYGYNGLGLVDYDPPIAPTPARAHREKTRRVHQSLPAPTLVDGRPT